MMIHVTFYKLVSFSVLFREICVGVCA
uniref:Uncharacterized protein n=1 Tax=Arundo donax TaxID=35708 RepID=A0A0A9H5W1_ARUDO